MVAAEATGTPPEARVPANRDRPSRSRGATGPTRGIQATAAGRPRLIPGVRPHEGGEKLTLAIYVRT